MRRSNVLSLPLRLAFPGGGNTAVEHSPHHPKVEGLSAVDVTVDVRDDGQKVTFSIGRNTMEKVLQKQMKKWYHSKKMYLYN